jgi:hypothetical protein
VVVLGARVVHSTVEPRLGVALFGPEHDLVEVCPAVAGSLREQPNERRMRHILRDDDVVPFAEVCTGHLHGHQPGESSRLRLVLVPLTDQAANAVDVQAERECVLAYVPTRDGGLADARRSIQMDEQGNPSTPGLLEDVAVGTAARRTRRA